jgi:hypothetical protein
MPHDQPIRDESNSGANSNNPGKTITCQGAVVPRVSKSCAEPSTEPVREIEWLWPGRLPLGAISLLSGDPGVGKSFLTLEIAARVTTGDVWPDGGANQRDSAIIISGEDDWSTTISSRLRWLNADLDRILCFHRIACRNGERKWSRPFEIGRDMPSLSTAIESLRDCRLVVIDPVTAFLGSVSENANNQVRNLLAPLASLAATHRLAVLLVSHLRKKRGPALYQTLGCQAFVALARSSWTVIVDPEDRERRILFSTKRNCGPDPGALAFSIVSLEPDHGATLVWDTQVVPPPIQDSAPHSGSPNRPAVRLHQAVEWLDWFLSTGAKPAHEVELASQGQSISVATLRRARRELGVESVKSRGTKHGCWLWQLPGSARSE